MSALGHRGVLRLKRPLNARSRHDVRISFERVIEADAYDVVDHVRGTCVDVGVSSTNCADFQKPGPMQGSRN